MLKLNSFRVGKYKLLIKLPKYKNFITRGKSKPYPDFANIDKIKRARLKKILDERTYHATLVLALLIYIILATVVIILLDLTYNHIYPEIINPLIQYNQDNNLSITIFKVNL